MTTRAAGLPALIAGFAAVYVIWGSTYLAIRFAVETLPPLLMAGVRFMLAGGVLWLALRWRGYPLPTWRQCRAAAVIGLLLLTGGNGLVCWAEQWVPSGIAALIVGTVPLWMVMLEWLAHAGKRPTIAVMAGVALGFAGVVILAINSQETGAAAGAEHQAAVRWGIAGLLLACVSWSIGSLRSRRVDQGPSLLVASAVQMLAGGAAMLLIGTIRGEWSALEIESISRKSLLAMAYLLVFGSLIGYSTYVWLLRVASPAAVSTYAYVNPIVAVLLGWWLGREAVSVHTLLAGAMIVGAVALMMIRRRAASSAPEVVKPVGAGCE